MSEIGSGIKTSDIAPVINVRSKNFDDGNFKWERLLIHSQNLHIPRDSLLSTSGIFNVPIVRGMVANYVVISTCMNFEVLVITIPKSSSHKGRL